MSAGGGYDPFMEWSDKYVSAKINLETTDATPPPIPSLKAEDELMPVSEPPTELVEEDPADYPPTYPDDDHSTGKSGVKATNDIPIQEKSDERFGELSLDGVQVCAPAEVLSPSIHHVNAADTDVVGSRDHAPTAESLLASSPEKRKYKTRKSEVLSLMDNKGAGIVESDKARGTGADSICTNVDESPRPMKKTKSEAYGQDNPKTSRQCPKCSKILYFRSERSAIGGYKLHVSKCIKGTEISDYSHVIKDSLTQRKQMMDASPDSHPPKKGEKNLQHTFVYSLTADPIPNRDLKMYISPRKSFVKSPDPRPCYGCNWCGCGRNDNAGNEETLCPACKLLKDDGWFRWVDNVAKKVIFIDNSSNKNSCPSIRAFLKDTTVVIREKLKKMSQKEEEALFSNLYEIEVAVEENGTPKERPNFSRPKREQSVAPRTNSPLDVKTDAKNARINKEFAIEFFPRVFSDAIKSNLARRCEDVGKDAVLNGHNFLHIFVRRKTFVCAPDPRPSLGCGWCGMTSKSDDLCPICESLKDFGYSIKKYASATYFYSPTYGQLKGVKEYLVRSTDVVAEAVNLLSVSDCALLREKYEQSEEIISTFVQVGKSTNSVSRADRSALQSKKKITSRGANIKSKEKKMLTRKTSITATKKPTRVTPRSRLSHVTKKKGANVVNDVVRPINQLSLPTIPQLLDLSLSEVLRADVFCVYNYHFGTNSNIAAKILLVLSEG
ncbi:hypothetical protein ACHAXA_006628 [Cyclostephanos tholiformis]|uniref:Uncharacterized protein n=1 Tax=Cyclostephanos tholiformis TaxID=382380 RepID=A0ABD3R508_9STRA